MPPGKLTFTFWLSRKERTVLERCWCWLFCIFWPRWFPAGILDLFLLARLCSVSFYLSVPSHLRFRLPSSPLCSFPPCYRYLQASILHFWDLRGQRISLSRISLKNSAERPHLRGNSSNGLEQGLRSQSSNPGCVYTANYLNSLCLSFPNCKMKMIIVPTPRSRWGISVS